ncbi:hypothetical protein BDW60DRAFT_13166 [Aspergillus nidulans var. acristatus]
MSGGYRSVIDYRFPGMVEKQTMLSLRYRYRNKGNHIRVHICRQRNPSRKRPTEEHATPCPMGLAITQLFCLMPSSAAQKTSKRTGYYFIFFLALPLGPPVCLLHSYRYIRSW